ncbi:MDR family MFS transporter [Tessaracoccus caeni]|uniref:MDR family MFS transporter n=1 Tax=Tessaracoccus caeni TaxID=3031239 RepID=UPI0023DA9417|nr:MDR family MFS transporter [Tessaracoccus caeni]MDF1489734.1 MDR family MFS transporter [Tessaracoccus caeni]
MSTTPSQTLAEPRPDSSTGSGRSTITWLFAGLMVTQLLAALSQTVLSTALPTIVGELGGVSQMSWVITGYILASTIMMPIYGRISDLLGRKPVLLAAIVIFLAGSIVGGVANDIWWLVGARVIQGLGGGGLMILSQAAIADVIPARDRGRYMGYMGAVFAVSSVAGPLLGGWLTEGPGWRWAFWLTLPLGAAAILATVFLLKLPPRPSTEKISIDYLGMTLLAGATTAVVLVCTWGGHLYDWASPQIIGISAAAVALSALFVIVERRAAQPVIPMSLFADRNFTLSTVAALLIGVMMFGAIGYFPTYLQMVTGVTATQAGLLMTPMMASLLVTSILSGRAVSRTGRYKKFPLIGSAIMGVGLVLISMLKVDSPLWWMCTVLGIFGAGIGLSNQILTLIVQNSVPNKIVGTATAASNFFRQVGATIGSAIVGSMFVSRLAKLIVEKLPEAAQLGGGGSNSLTPDTVAHLPEAVRIPIIESYNEALLPIFLFMIPLAVATLIVLFFVKETSLATRIERGRG